MFSLLIADLRKRGARSLLLLLGAVAMGAAFGLLAPTASTVVVTTGCETEVAAKIPSTGGMCGE